MQVLDKIPNQKHLDLASHSLDNDASLNVQKSQFLGDLIELKRSRDKWNHEHSKLFLVIGLVLSLTFTIAAFEWKTYEQDSVVDLGMIKNDFDEILEIPPTEQAPPPPPPQKIITPIIRAVDDKLLLEEVEITIDLETTEDMIIEVAPNFEFTSDAPVEMVEEIFDIVESRPEPVGGLSAFYKYVSENMKYPEKAIRLDIEGRVFFAICSGERW